MDLFPSGYATREEFPRFVQIILGVEKPDEEFVDMLFRSMDQNRDGKISLLEFLWYKVLMLTRPTCPIEYLIEHTFMVYDMDRNGYITRKELFDTMSNIYKFNGINVKDEKERRQIEEKVDKIMDVVDENRDGKITQQEMSNAYKRDPTIFENIF
jgi:Ca2+-binding EF-hand superfamily protein